MAGVPRIAEAEGPFYLPRGNEVKVFEQCHAKGLPVLLKGPTTVIATPDGGIRVVAAGDARLATAGTGDVLTGTIGALLARGLDAFDAAAAGAWLHARAGAAVPIEGLVASDLVEALPRAVAELAP